MRLSDLTPIISLLIFTLSMNRILKTASVDIDCCCTLAFLGIIDKEDFKFIFIELDVFILFQIILGFPDIISHQFIFAAACSAAHCTVFSLELVNNSELIY